MYFMTVEELIKELDKFPKDAEVTPYEGEAIGITIYSTKNEYGFIYSHTKTCRCTFIWFYLY